MAAQERALHIQMFPRTEKSRDHHLQRVAQSPLVMTVAAPVELADIKANLAAQAEEDRPVLSKAQK